MSGYHHRYRALRFPLKAPFPPLVLPLRFHWRWHQRSISACGGGSRCSVCGTHNQIDLLSLVSPTRPIKSRRRRNDDDDDDARTDDANGSVGLSTHSTYGVKGRQPWRAGAATSPMHNFSRAAAETNWEMITKPRPSLPASARSDPPSSAWPWARAAPVAIRAW